MQLSSDFAFPDYYNWRCFFTLQIHPATREKQLKMWQDLICSYAQKNKIHSWGLNELYASALCDNKTLNRSLSRKDFTAIIQYMISKGRC